MHRLREIRRAAASLLFPNRCPFCDELVGADRYWCDSCHDSLPFLEKMPPAVHPLDGVYACCAYRNMVVAAVHRMKKGYYSYAPDAFAVLMAELSGDITDRIDLVTSVPTSFRRRIEIGYHHTERMARDIAVRRGFRYRRLLKLAGKRREQKQLTREQRFSNAAGFFRAIRREEIKGRNILLIDDVTTTGATLSAAAEVLKGAGAAKVYALTFAQTQLSRPNNQTEGMKI